MHKPNIFFIIFIIIFLNPCLIKTIHSVEIPFFKERNEMVSSQIEARGVRDKRVLDAMRSVPRDKFVPWPFHRLAYSDEALPIGEGQTISQPYIVALMTSALSLKESDRVLEIGTGSGYQAAILAELTKEVYSIEIKPALAKQAESTLKNLGYKNIKIKIGDGYLGWSENAPFDAIIVTCAPEDIPMNLIKQLKDRGRMVLPLSNGYPQSLILVEKKNGGITQRRISEVMFVPMLHNPK